MSSCNQLELPDCITIGEVADLHEQWKSLACEDELSIDASGVQMIDAAGMQLLLALVREQVGNGISVRWESDSGKFSEVVTTLGMNSVLGIQ